MSDRINEYREAKNTYFQLRNQAKKELVARFHELAQELLQLQRELLEDFGQKIPIPTKPGKSRPKKAAKSVSKKQAPTKQSLASKTESTSKPSAAQRQLQQQKKKLADAQAAGKPTKTIEDRIYELEDEIRLEQAK